MSLHPAILGAGLLIAAPVQAAQSVSLAAELKAKTQALADAIAPGDVTTWKAATDPRLLFVNENNEILTKDQLLKQLQPLPKGLVGHIAVTNFKAVEHGDTAVTTYVADESLDYYGQLLRTRFRTTDTWHREGGKWTMIASMTLAVLNDPPAITLPATLMAEYVGRYELTPEIHYEVSAKDGRLFGQRDGGKEVELHPESPDLFFVAGLPRSRKVFYRDATGKVIGFGDRREGQDIKWKRLF